MSESGGVGLADLIMRQFGGTPEKTAPPRTRGLSNAISAVRDIKTAPAEPKNTKNVSSFINKSAKFEPVSMNPTNSGEVEIISTFEDEVRTEGLDSSLKNLMLDGRIVNSTRPRIAPNAPVTEIPTTVPPADMPRVANSDARVTYQMPVVGRISSGFGNRFHPIDRKVKFHGGIDIAVPTGTKVGAAADGIVKFAGWKGGYGNVVIIEHPDGSETLYGHNSKLLVVEGQKVVAGEPISLSGSTGKSTGPHVHFEIRQNGQLVNPAKFLSNVLSKNAER
ncbi:MAG: peptidoglycan DD-metalloendopeptidase family protein [Acidobacteria bacterium]|nr:peptidoglycan DD-metalloendopeptidase family protein [Acidobacteriota bacterium]